MNQIDLHIHSAYSSDGTYTPEELAALCKSAGITVMAIADHNTTAGCLRGMTAAWKAGIRCIPAVELDCICTFRNRRTNLHILGYGIDPIYSGFLALEQRVKAQERAASGLLLDRAEGLGLALNRERVCALSHDGVVTGELIAEVALEMPENEQLPLLTPYRPGGQRSDNPFVNFYWDWCAPGRPAHVPVAYISLEECVDLIRSGGGVPVLAHPGNNVKEDDGLLRHIMGRGVAGIEVYSSYHSPEQVIFYRNAARRLGAFMTCGSDFHGKTKPAIRLGQMELDGDEAEITDRFLALMSR